MSEFARIEPVQSDKIFQIGRFHLAGVGQAWTTWDDIRDAVIDKVTIHGKAQQPAVILRLIRGFLQRLPLPIATLFGSCPSADGSSMLSCPGYGLAVPR